MLNIQPSYTRGPPRSSGFDSIDGTITLQPTYNSFASYRADEADVGFRLGGWTNGENMLYA